MSKALSDLEKGKIAGFSWDLMMRLTRVPELEGARKLCGDKNCSKFTLEGRSKAGFFFRKRILNCPKTDGFDSLFIPAHSFSSESVVSLRVR